MSGFLKLLAAILVVGILACIVVIGTIDLNPKEATLLSILLTVVSILASWLVSHIYSESQHRQAIYEVQELHRTNLRTYALKAAEKVNNLSNELNRLVLYLEQALSNTDYESSDEALLAKEERITSAIHIANTLKSVNDTSLSDWRGVIGEELEQQREEREEREEELRDLMERVESLEEYQEDVIETPGNTKALKAEIDSIKGDLRLVLTSLSGTPLMIKPPSRPKYSVEKPCPHCHNMLTFRQKPRHNTIKTVKCASCGSSLVSKYENESGYTLKIREKVNEPFVCPVCGGRNETLLDSAPGASIVLPCSSCQKSIRVFRSTDGIGARINETKAKAAAKPVEELTEYIVQKVREKLPPQPWPTGTNKKVAQELGLSGQIVQDATKELIRRGIFKHQIDGVLYERATPLEKTESAMAKLT